MVTWLKLIFAVPLLAGLASVGATTTTAGDSGVSNLGAPVPGPVDYRGTNNVKENKHFAAKIVPIECTTYGCRSFVLTVTNKTNKNLEINWNKTLYIADSQTSGGFMFPGTRFLDRDNPKLPDIVLPNGQLTKELIPSRLVRYVSSWSHDPMGPGEHGVFLTVIVNQIEISEAMTLTIFAP